MSHRIRRCILYYRGIFILNNDFNVVYGSLVIPYLKFILSVVIVVGMFALIRLHNAMGTFSLVLAGTMVCCSVLFLVPIAIVMSSMYKISTQFSRTLRLKVETLPNRRERLVYRRDLRSSQLIRCKIGKLYHMESKAKLTWVQKLVNGTKYILVNFK